MEPEVSNIRLLLPQSCLTYEPTTHLYNHHTHK
jgi:hypothetical protein